MEAFFANWSVGNSFLTNMEEEMEAFTGRLCHILQDFKEGETLRSNLPEKSEVISDELETQKTVGTLNIRLENLLRTRTLHLDCFQNLQELQVGSLPPFTSLQRFLGKVCSLYPQLTTLEVRNIVDPRFMDIDYMDACVTGIPDDKCWELRCRLSMTPCEELEDPECYFHILEEMERQCRSSSFLSLKGLKSVTLRSAWSNCNSSSGENTERERIANKFSEAQVFSAVAFIYVFDRMPQVSVSVYVGGPLYPVTFSVI